MSLSQIKKALKELEVLEADDNILHLSFNEGDSPFAMIIENNNKLLVSFSADFHDASLAGVLITRICYIQETAVAEPFLFTEEGDILFGDEARANATKPDIISLNDIEPINTQRH